ncbi:MAG TPA: hypothetical protein VGH38_29470, partial [Bryobacteraceae bacterium]
MKLIRGLLLAWLTLGGVGGTGLGSRTAAGPQITVRLVNAAQVPARTLDGAERVAAWILGQAGVETTWLECPCAPETAATELRFQILNLRSMRLSRDAMGFAVLLHPREEG